MLYAIIAIFKPDIEARRDALHQQFNDHLAQPIRRIRLAGSLRTDGGDRRGILMLLEAETRDQVQHFIDSSPYTQAGLYESVRIDPFDTEVGRLG